jgi:hypothetical protein
MLEVKLHLLFKRYKTITDKVKKLSTDSLLRGASITRRLVKIQKSVILKDLLLLLIYIRKGCTKQIDFSAEVAIAAFFSLKQLFLNYI